MTAQDESSPFVPDGFDPPRALDHDAFRLRPLTAAHNERDHAAWMGSLDHIRATPGFPDGTGPRAWPQPMSLEDNRADLERHDRDFGNRVGFTYTVLAPEGPEETADVIGCVYLYPSKRPEADVEVQSWVRADHADLDAELATTLLDWLDADWPWSRDRVHDHPRPAASGRPSG